MNKIPGFFVGTPKDCLLAEIDAALESAFADFHQRASDKVRAIILAASSEQVQTYLTVHQAPVPIAASVEHHLLPLVELTSAAGHSTSWAELNLKGTGPSLERNQEHDDSNAKHPQELRHCNLVSSGQGHADRDPTSHQLFSVQFTPENPEEEQSKHSSAPDPAADLITRSFSRRPSRIGTPDYANLRQELDWHSISERPASALCALCFSFCNLAKALCRCRCIGAGRIEPKDLHLDQLAALKGKQWKQMSFREQVEIIREELVSTSLIIDPEMDTMKIWDILVMCCLVLTALFLPYEIAFLESDYGPMYIMNRCVDVIFIVDMVMQFFLKVRVEVKHKTRWVRNRKQIASIYLKSWFAVDLLSILPYDDISNLASSGNDTGMQHLKIMRLLRVLRLLKLFRMLKASRLVKRWENRNSLQSSTKHLIKCCVLIFVSVHWMACIWGFFGIWEGSNLKCRRTLKNNDPFVLASPTASWYVDIDEGRAPNEPSAWTGQSWVVAFALSRASSNPIDPCDPLILYTVSIYWAIMTMTSIGYGDIVPQTISEYVVVCLCMVVSGIAWAYIIGTASSVLSNMYPESTEFEQRLDAFNAMVGDMQIPRNIRLRGREFLRESRYKWNHDRNLAVIQSLGFDLQAHLSKQSAQLYLGNVGLFSRCSKLFCADCAASMVPHFFEANYIIQLPKDLCVVEKGAIGHAGRVLVPCNHWGEDFIVAKMQLRFRPHAVALSYSLVVSLSSEKVNDVMARHPVERLLFARAAVCMAFRGAVRVYLDDIAEQRIVPETKWIHEIIDRPTSSKPTVASLVMPQGRHDDLHDAHLSSSVPSYSELMSLPKGERSRNLHSLEHSLEQHRSKHSSTYGGET